MGLTAYIILQITPTPMLRAGEGHLMIACSLGLGLGHWIRPLVCVIDLGHKHGPLIWAMCLGSRQPAGSQEQARDTRVRPEWVSLHTCGGVRVALEVVAYSASLLMHMDVGVVSVWATQFAAGFSLHLVRLFRPAS